MENEERGRGIIYNLIGKDIIATSDWTKGELDQVLDLAFRFKNKGESAAASEVWHW